jgi:2',3'-cyclic-nucleotide 2'-phosphodiesterase (5'-nucleotidase family)
LRFFRKQLFILTTIFTLLASYVLPYISSASAAENYITVEQAIANNSGTATVKGYIVAHTTGTNSYDFEAPFGNDYNFGIADSSSETDPAKILPVQITSSYRSQFGLASNPTNIGKEVFVTGTLKAYFTVPGLQTPTYMGFEPPVTDPVDPPFEGVEGLKIYDIQGAAHVSPYKDQNVKAVEGIVTYVVDSSNFYMQSVTPDDDVKTSEGILVYKPGHAAALGDHVTVNGLVKEWVLDGYSDRFDTDLAMTEINAQNGSVTKIASNLELPTPIVIDKNTVPSQVVDNDQFGVFDPSEDGIDYYESLEGMRVSIENPIAVAPQKYGEVPVIAGKVEGKLYTTPGGLPITKDNMNPERLHLLFGNRDFVAKTGDQFNGTVTGVVSYSFQNYKILTNEADLPELIESSYTQETTDIEKASDKLTVATYNMENYTQAETEKTAKIAESIVNNLKTPDIIGLVEVQDNNGESAGGTDADQNYQALIDAIKAVGGPAYEWTDIAPVDGQDGGAPNGNIRVGFIYNPERVTLKAGTKGTATQAVGYENGSLTLNPGRIDPTNSAFNSSRKPLAAEFTFNGEEVIVIANHFNSKRGDQPIFGQNQPPVLGSETQRMAIAGVVNSFIKDVKSKNADANIVVVGDLNDFEFSNPLTALKGNELTNLIEMVPAAERFTYNYQGNSQVLDHLLVSNNLASSAEIDIVHLNSPFMEAHGRVSDHDAILAQLDLTNGEEPYQLSIMHVNDSHANVEQYPKLTTAVNQVRESKPSALLVDAGDVFSGTLYFNQYLGKADLEFMNDLGYDAMTFGNHEFDKDSAILADFIKDMQFPMVSANVNVTSDPVLGALFQNEISAIAEGGKIYPAIIKEVDGEQIGIFGLTTEDTSYLANPSDHIVFENAAEKATATVAALEAKGINKIVVLSHLGYGPDKELAAAVNGIDVIVGGHTHTKLTGPEVIEKAEPTVIVQANEYLKFLGVLDVTFDENGVVTNQAGNLLDVNTFTADADAQAKVDVFKAPLEELKKTVIGTSSVFLDGERANVRSKETNLGNLITDAMVQRAKALGQDTYIAMQNGGGIRASIDVGDVTLGEIHTTMPFANLLVTLDLTGAEILEALEHSVSKVESGAGQFMQVSGIQFKYDPAKPAYDRVWEVKLLTASGYETLDLTKTYSVATNAFVADGGDGYTVFKQAKTEGRINELLIVDYEILSDYIAANSPVSPSVEGRITAEEEQDEIANGWYFDGLDWFYYDNGQIITGWLNDDGTWYYLDLETGVMQTGWEKVNNKWYYLDSTGAMQVGWEKVNNKWYYLAADGAMQTGWIYKQHRWYYLDSTGAMQIGWKNLNNKWYYLAADGAMQTGWVKSNSKWYYLATNGAMQTGWIYNQSKWYYLDSTGAMQTGWVKVNGQWFYMNTNGAMMTGWIYVGGKWYFLYNAGQMAINATVKGFKLGADGALIS